MWGWTNREKKMTRLRIGTGSVSVLGILSVTLLVGGCGGFFPTNESACRAVVNHTFGCIGTLVPLPPGSTGDAAGACATIPETSECADWRALAACITSASCDELISDPETLQGCTEILTRLEINGCGPAGG